MIILLGAILLLAQDPKADPPVNCAEAQTTLDMERCASTDVATSEARVRTYLAAARTALRADVEADAPGMGDAAVAALDASQVQWSAYYAGACDVVYSRWQGGTIRGLMALGCKERLLLDRAHDLWSDYLVGLGDQEPVLPEPMAPDAVPAT
ncbi:hypothetical protein BH10PSE2_BH10PSE2_07920 [soil metagenome]